MASRLRGKLDLVAYEATLPGCGRGVTIQKRVIFLGTVVALTAFVCLRNTPTGDCQSCLPPNIKLTDIVSIERDKHGKTIKKKTVRDKLKELKAHCRNGHLADARGKQVYFYRLIGCWGNPPQNYLEQLDQQRSTLELLQKKYTVIQMTCDASDVPIP